MFQLFRPWQKVFFMLFLVLLVFQSAGWLLAWSVAQIGAKHQARVAIMHTNAPLESFTLPAAKLAVLQIGKKEIWLDGRLYDIKTRVRQGDSIILTLYHDRHEEALFNTLSALLSPHDQPGKCGAPLRVWLAQWLGLIYLVPATPVLPKPPAPKFFPALFRLTLPARQAMPEISAPPPER